MQDLLTNNLGMLMLLVVPAALSMFAQFWVKSTFSKYSNSRNARNINGAQAAKTILEINGIRDVAIQSVSGMLTDHYDPGQKALRLSEPVYASTSIAAVGVSAHETGHAIQHNVKYAPLVLRSTLVPVANIGSSIGPYLIIAGIVASMSILTNLGIILFGGAVAFYIITLPVEFNASRRALQNLEANNILNSQELNGAKKVLTAAALTYVASALTAVANLLRLILIARNRRRN